MFKIELENFPPFFLYQEEMAKFSLLPSFSLGKPTTKVFFLLLSFKELAMELLDSSLFPCLVLALCRLASPSDMLANIQI